MCDIPDMLAPGETRSGALSSPGRKPLTWPSASLQVRRSYSSLDLDNPPG